MFRIVNLSTNGVHLRKEQGFLVASLGTRIIRTPVDEISAIIVDAYQGSISLEVLRWAFSENVALVVVDRKHVPIGYTLPVDPNIHAKRRLIAQVNVDGRLIQELWQNVVQMKIEQQASLLDLVGRKGSSKLRKLAQNVRPGDPGNVEAIAARYYWPALFGSEFRRRDSDPRNACLNYGYAVLRAAVARYLIATGLHPAFSIHHETGSLALADDLMEPFRPAVDLLVARRFNELTLAAKQQLAKIVELETRLNEQATTLDQAIRNLVSFIAASYEKGAINDEIPHWFLEAV